MPDVKVYIRTDDLDKWRAIAKKSEWLHSALNGESIARVEKISKDPFKQFLKDYSVPGERKAPHPTYGYPCCHKKSPCKHWIWDESEMHWFNQLTGETKDDTL